ncbi:hypothetical protein [Devosia sp. SD17-2]|uniref:hypothetical protein n=1 Tax=Devosia sp. SD17-2 TaxID=2976459 RepID=UPI0023D7C746|nr:hypothetical protein [Devosia sp. SD17-2]WEJ34015.1 hypothetical protein NYQ88_04150 [Devosia sp. SD17-2]
MTQTMMMMTTKIKGLMLASGLATLAMLQPAMALDAQAFMQRIADVYKMGGYDITFDTATANGDTVVVDGLNVSITGVDEAIALDTQLTFTGVSETDDGGFTAERLTVPDIDTNFSEDPVGRVTVTGIVVEDIYLPPAGPMDTVDLMMTAGRMATGPITVTRDGADFFSIAGIDATNEFSFDANDELTDIVSVFDITDIRADLSAASEEDPDTAATIEALGLTTISGNINQSMSWTMTDGHVVIDQFLMDFDNVGALNFTADLSGLTPAILDKIYAMQASTMDPTSEEAQAKQMMLGMELLQAISLAGVNVRYDEDSLAGKLLDFYAAQSGAERAEFVEGIKAMLPQMIGQFGIPALSDMVVPAVTAFLDNPQSFEVAIKPAQPTSLLVLSAAAANPAGLISALGLAVTANQ